MIELTGRVFCDGVLRAGRLRFEADRIDRVELDDDAALASDAPIIAPGLVDLHVHGFGGCDPLDDLAGMARALALAGTTTFQPTLFPGPPPELGRDAARVWAAAAALAPRAGARVAGLHLEGPFLNPGAAGAIPVDALVAPSLAGLAEILGPATDDGRGIRTVTIAPEVPGSADLIAELVRCGVRVSLGHSLASAADTRAATRAGAVGATHLFNAMGPLHHRDVGIVGIALTERALYAEIIGDLTHVGRDAFDLALRLRGPTGLCLVSDALRGAGTGCDVFHWHGREHLVRDGTAYYPPRDAGGEPQLAGCASSQLEMVRKLVGAGVLSVEDALTMASATPAAALGMADGIGNLRPGAFADVLVLDSEELTLREVYVGGERATGPAQAFSGSDR